MTGIVQNEQELSKLQKQAQDYCNKKHGQNGIGGPAFELSLSFSEASGSKHIKTIIIDITETMTDHAHQPPKDVVDNLYNYVKEHAGVHPLFLYYGLNPVEPAGGQ